MGSRRKSTTFFFIIGEDMTNEEYVEYANCKIALHSMTIAAILC